MSVCRRVSSPVVAVLNNETFPGLSVAPVRVTSAARMLTFVGGVSVIARTTGAVPDGGVPPTIEPRPPQLVTTAQQSDNGIKNFSGPRNIELLPTLPDVNATPVPTGHSTGSYLKQFVKSKLAQRAGSAWQNRLHVEQRVHVPQASATTVRSARKEANIETAPRPP